MLLSADKVFNTRSQKDRPAPWYTCPAHAVLIQHPDATLLWDTGVSRDWEREWVPAGMQEYFPYDQVDEDQYFDKRLEQIGIAPADVDILVLSHLHTDHAGNARLFANSKTRILAHQAEIDWAMGFEGPAMGGYIKADYEHLDLEGVRGDVEILPGVTLLETPGHTPGNMSLRVDLPNDGTLIFATDAVYMRESYGPPPVQPAIVADNREYARSMEKIRNLAQDTSATVIFGHDDEQIHKLKLAPTAHYS
jgi:glyoxylase-like metal-dependent hydrolase (beta-lactamase superfamily II)